MKNFLKKYPYKVGDKVEYKSIGDANLKSKIIYMEWCNSLNEVLYMTEDAHVISTEDIIETKTIPSYMDYDIKEEIMEEKGDKAKAPNLVGEDYSGKRFGYKIPKGYEVDCIQNNEIIIKPIKPQYPKTYEECYDILGLLKPSDDDSNIFGYKTSILRKFQKLLICRDAYWKIAGEELGLGKPWEPDWSTESEKKYVIEVYLNNIRTNLQGYSNTTLSFPTVEMRNTFFENFKDLIERCKELL